MAINPELVKKARAAGARLAETEREVQRARSEYHGIIRRIHLAGSSLREIAQALELSHQRVQQMVQGAGGTWWQRMRRRRNLKANLACTFCGHTRDEVARLIAGPKTYICDSCVADAEKCAKGAGSLLALAKHGSKARCSFCAKRGTTDNPLLTGREGNICGRCLAVCRHILEDSAV